MPSEVSELKSQLRMHAVCPLMTKRWVEPSVRAADKDGLQSPYQPSSPRSDLTGRQAGGLRSGLGLTLRGIESGK